MKKLIFFSLLLLSFVSIKLYAEPHNFYGIDKGGIKSMSSLYITSTTPVLIISTGNNYSYTDTITDWGIINDITNSYSICTSTTPNVSFPTITGFTSTIGNVTYINVGFGISSQGKCNNTSVWAIVPPGGSPCLISIYLFKVVN